MLRHGPLCSSPLPPRAICRWWAAPASSRALSVGMRQALPSGWEPSDHEHPCSSTQKEHLSAGISDRTAARWLAGGYAARRLVSVPSFLGPWMFATGVKFGMSLPSSEPVFLLQSPSQNKMYLWEQGCFRNTHTVPMSTPGHSPSPQLLLTPTWVFRPTVTLDGPLPFLHSPLPPPIIPRHPHPLHFLAQRQSSTRNSTLHTSTHRLFSLEEAIKERVLVNCRKNYCRFVVLVKEILL